MSSRIDRAEHLEPATAFSRTVSIADILLPTLKGEITGFLAQRPLCGLAFDFR